jgi:glycosyltransferase involved in cell wall biosynthesis
MGINMKIIASGYLDTGEQWQRVIIDGIKKTIILKEIPENFIIKEIPDSFIIKESEIFAEKKIIKISDNYKKESNIVKNDCKFYSIKDISKLEIHHSGIYISDFLDKNIQFEKQNFSYNGQKKLALIDRTWGIGGAVWSLCLLAKYLDKDKIYPKIYSAQESEITKYLTKIGIEVSIGNCSNDLLFADWLIKELKEWQPDIVDYPWSPHWGFRSIREIVPKMVAHAQATFVPWATEEEVPYCSNDPFIRENLDKIICVANCIAEEFKEKFNNKAVVIPSPVDCNEFKNATAHKKMIRNYLKIPQNDFVVFWSGRICNQKRPDLLIEIYDIVTKKIKNCKFVVAGVLDKSSENTELGHKWLIDISERDIIWITDMKPYHASMLYNSSNVFLLNSDYEGLSLSSLEALASGIPVVCTNVSGQSEAIIDCFNGFLCEKGNSEELARKIIQYYEYPKNEKRKIKNNCIKSASKFDAKMNAEKTMEIYLNE